MRFTNIKTLNNQNNGILNEHSNINETIENHLLKDNKSTEQTEKENDHEIKSSNEKDNNSSKEHENEIDSDYKFKTTEKFANSYALNEIDIETIQVQNIDNGINENNFKNNKFKNGNLNNEYSSQGSKTHMNDEFNLYNLVNHDDVNPSSSHLIGFRTQQSQQSLNSNNREK